jgi:hypothetical protein
LLDLFVNTYWLAACRGAPTRIGLRRSWGLQDFYHVARRGAATQERWLIDLFVDADCLAACRGAATLTGLR